jgi:thymidylate synthase (FAD)
VCLTGDTLISSVHYANGRPEGTKKRRLETLFALTQTRHGRSRIPLLHLRSLDEGTGFFRASKVRRIGASGQKPAFAVGLEGGYRGKMTLEHRLYTSDGWMTLEQLFGEIEVQPSGLTCDRAAKALVGVNGYTVASTAVALVDGTIANRDRPWVEARIRGANRSPRSGR